MTRPIGPGIEMANGFGGGALVMLWYVAQRLDDAGGLRVSPVTGAGEQPEGSRTATAEGDAAVLRAVVEGTAGATGEGFFQNLVRHLAGSLGVTHAFVAELTDQGRARTIAYWTRDRIADNIEWTLRGTPCEDVVRGELCHYPSGVKDRFPQDKPLAAMGIESYLGVPLRDHAGRTMGHLAVFDVRPMPVEPRVLYIFKLFAMRAAAELDRLRVARELAESERRYRDLYEEAPIAYIYEDLESRFVRANRAAMKLLGIEPAEVVGTLGKSLLAPVPETQERIREALKAMRTQGKEFAGVELELRRKDNGRPIWVQWWSKPEPDGKHTRTMLVDVTDRVLMEREKARLEQQNLYLREEIKQAHNFDEIVGRSPKLAIVLDNVRRVAPTDATVLITGETGTGKELFARAIHSASGREAKPLIKVNCAALPAGLVESELFGHERGAFSGAIARRIGRFELAHGGTIFLDEIGELTLDVQTKLLRVLQEHEFDRVGGQKPIKVDVRVIAATNHDLEKCVREGTFRQDLYYRLNVFPIVLPPLRERREDIPLLVRFLMTRFRARLGKRLDRVDEPSMQRMLNYAWPGNVRELENVLERAAILCNTPALEVSAEMLPVAATQKQEGALSNQSLEAVERSHLLTILKQTNWVIDGVGGAARILDVHPNTLRSRLKKLGIARPSHEVS
jgi:PAS domain S-box-containing protein